jgi:hypothetical protein
VEEKSKDVFRIRKRIKYFLGQRKESTYQKKKTQKANNSNCEFMLDHI